jgi:hypothetical protein
LESPLDAATYIVFNRDPIPVNVLLLSVAFVVGSALVSFAYVRSRGIRRDFLEDEAEGAREALMTTAIGNGYGT